MLIEEICELLINELIANGYDDSTIFNYRAFSRRFKEFCEEKEVYEYSPDIGKLYAEAVISKKTGKFSEFRRRSQGRFVRLLNSFYFEGKFDLSAKKTGKLFPKDPQHLALFNEFNKFLSNTYENENTIHFYSYGMYRLLRYLSEKGETDIESMTPKSVFKYIADCGKERTREIVCTLRFIFKFLGRKDLLEAITGIQSPRIKRIIPTLTEEELNRLNGVIESGKITFRDAAIVLLGLSCGIRACDLIKLKLSDIDWINETITFKQSKTGNTVCIPLIATVGNAMFQYLQKERPSASNDYLFVRQLAPFNPLADHATCYNIVNKVFTKAKISKDNRFFGMHMLRHNAASTMLKNRVAIETIAAILGHSSPDATDIYITTDAKRLVECVLPMGAISQEVNP
ncbi:MAG: tyrosine-type recombinase/integrase [Christensenellales bacterium]|jgi:integrase|nr:tyrosine-type recombinase/integrase [Methanosarcina sp.]